MALCLGKLSRDRLKGVHPDRVRVVERASRSRSRTSRFRKARARVSARLALVAVGASRTMKLARHLAGHAIDLPALNGEDSWQWKD